MNIGQEKWKKGKYHSTKEKGGIVADASGVVVDHERVLGLARI